MLVAETGATGWEVLWKPFGKKPSQNLKGSGMLVSRDLQAALEAELSALESLAYLFQPGTYVHLREESTIGEM